MKPKTYKKGELVRIGSREVIFQETVNADQVMVLNPASGLKEVVSAEEIISRKAGESPAYSSALVLSDSQWKKAEKKHDEVIRPLLDGGCSAQLRDEIASKAGVHRSTVYRWRKKFIATGLVSSLADKPRGRKKGKELLGSAVEKILVEKITKKIRSPYISLKEVKREVDLACTAAGLRSPHFNTFRSRYNKISQKMKLKSEGLAEGQEHIRPGGSLITECILEVIQIDHTLMDIELVDSVSRQPIGRPWITLAIDIHSRCVVGLYISLDPPSVNSVGLCLYRAFTPKQAWLDTLGVEGKWRMHGLAMAVHADNAKEFRSEMLNRVCKQHGIDIHWRPIGKARWGGHIERLMGLTAEQLKRLPGATFSNPKERDKQAARRSPALTLDELEKIMVHWIVNIYHKELHSAIGRSPEAAWLDGVLGPSGVGLPKTVDDEYRLRIELMPSVERTVNEFGVRKDGIYYYASVLRSCIGAVLPGRSKIRRKFTFYYDYRDLSKIYFIDLDSGNIHDIPYRNRGYPPVSRWELRAARKKVREREGRAGSEAHIFAALEDMRAMAREGELKTKRERRERERRSRNREILPKRQSSLVQSSGADESHSVHASDEAVDAPIAPKSPRRYQGIEIE